MSDIFEPIRQEIRYLQAHLRDEEDFVSREMDRLRELIRIGLAPANELHLRTSYIYRGVHALENAIVRMLTKIPPHAREHDGYVELLPPMPNAPPLDPRKPV